MHARILICLFHIGLCLSGWGAAADSTAVLDTKSDTLLQLSAVDSASLETIKELIKDGQYIEAESRARELLDRVKAEHGAESIEAAQVMDQLIESLWRGEKTEEEETLALAERALTIKENLLGPKHLLVAESLHQLAIIAYELGEIDKSERLDKRALAIREEILGPDNEIVSKSLNNLAITYQRKGNYEEAIALRSRILAIIEKEYGPDHERTAQALSRLARAYGWQGRHDKSRPLIERALAIQEQVFGSESNEYAETLGLLAYAYSTQGKLDEALPLMKQVIDISENVYGPEDPKVAIALNNLGRALGIQGELDKAEQLHLRARAIQEKNLGPDHPDYAATLEHLASLYRRQGRFADAIPLFQQAGEIWEAYFGPEHRTVASALGNLAIVYSQQGRYREAEPLVKRAMEIFKKVHGPESQYVSYCLDHLANIYRYLGLYTKSELYYKQALAKLEKVLGPDHINVTGCLGNLGILLTTQGRYAEAEPLFKRALAIKEETFGQENPDVALGIQNLAWLYRIQGKHAEAERLYRRSLEIRQKVLGDDHLDLAVSLYGLAMGHWERGDYAGAERHLKRSLAIRENALGPDHPEVAWTVSALADLYYYELNRPDEAESLYERALAIWENALGPEHSSVGSGLRDLATFYADHGRFADAEPLFKRALAIKEQSLGPDHTGVAWVLEGYSRHYRQQRKSDEALRLARRAIAIRRNHFEDNVSVLAEKDAISFSGNLRESVDKYLSCYVDLAMANPNENTAAADIILAAKGYVSDGIFERRGRMVRLLAGAEDLRLAKFQLSQLYVEGPDDDPDTYRDRMDSLSRLTNKLEAELARTSSGYHQIQDYKNIDAERITWQIPNQSALIEYLKFRFHHLDPDTVIPHYMALILKSGEEPMLIELGEVRPIDLLLEKYRHHQLEVASEGQNPSIIHADEYTTISSRLYEKIWKPIADHVADREMVLIAPDGGLNMLSFAGLLDDEGKYLIEKHAIHYLSSGRDLIRLKERSEPATGLFALGDPDYDADIMARLSEPENTGDTSAEPVYYAATRNVRSGCGELNELMVDRLPGTRTEIEQIAESWREAGTEPLTTYFGSEASEEKFKLEAPGNRVIHLATHGYFLEGTCQPVIHRSRISTETDYIGENPLLLSGLFLAGANLHGEGSDQEGAEDGILTAYEVSEMVLDGTELVVLSACETGLGEVKEGEGVYGLRRAFQMAGARTVISALWPVSDKATAEIMGRLYDRGDETLPERMRRIQLEKINELRAKNEVDHPYSWGAFIALGDWR